MESLKNFKRISCANICTSIIFFGAMVCIAKDMFAIFEHKPYGRNESLVVFLYVLIVATVTYLYRRRLNWKYTVCILVTLTFQIIILRLVITDHHWIDTYNVQSTIFALFSVSIFLMLSMM